jgi:hypothetical protein
MGSDHHEDLPSNATIMNGKTQSSVVVELNAKHVDATPNLCPICGFIPSIIFLAVHFSYTSNCFIAFEILQYKTKT